MPRDDDRRRRHGGGGGRGGRRDDEDDEEVEESGIQAQLPTRLQLGVLVGTGVSVCRARIFPAARALTLAACRLHSARADPGGRLYQLDLPRDERLPVIRADRLFDHGERHRAAAEL